MILGKIYDYIIVKQFFKNVRGGYYYMMHAEGRRNFLKNTYHHLKRSKMD
jgi:hypothetical protein